MKKFHIFNDSFIKNYNFYIKIKIFHTKLNDKIIIFYIYYMENLYIFIIFFIKIIIL